jgi:hypothetical protein
MIYYWAAIIKKTMWRLNPNWVAGVTLYIRGVLHTVTIQGRIHKVYTYLYN